MSHENNNDGPNSETSDPYGVVQGLHEFNDQQAQRRESGAQKESYQRHPPEYKAACREWAKRDYWAREKAANLLGVLSITVRLLRHSVSLLAPAEASPKTLTVSWQLHGSTRASNIRKTFAR